MKSIIIPVMNNFEITEQCVLAVRENTRDCEIVIIDNGSEPAYKAPFAEIPITVIRNDENKGFPAAVNQGIRAAQGDVIILLNNDCIVTPGWADKLLFDLSPSPCHFNDEDECPNCDTMLCPGQTCPNCYPNEDDDGYQIVAPVTNYCAGMQRVQVSEYQSVEELNKSAAEWAENFSGEVQPVNWVIGFCMAFRKSLYDELGEFDESLWPCSGEEIDFCYRARAAGHKVGIVLGCYVHHEGSMTFNAMDIDYEALCKRNDAHLAKKWGNDFFNKQKVAPEIEDGIRLNLGCGRFHLQGFTNIDQFEDVKPDLHCDITCLPFKAGTVDEIYAGHVLEHFHFEDGKNALRYWQSLLRPGGKISICVPDYDYLVKKYVENPSPDALIDFNDTFIYSGIQPSPHLYAYSAALLERVMNEVGFINVERMPVNHPYFTDPVLWQCAFTAIKG
jgi:GT2 family glycosyltransferase